MSILRVVSKRIGKIVERCVPEPFAFAILMTIISLLLVWWLTPFSATETLSAWGSGLSALLPFMTQMALMVLFAYALANLGPVPRWLDRIATLPKSPMQAYAGVAIFTGLVSLINWPLGLISGALLARATGRSAARREIHLHYPLLGGSAMGGFVVWHMGYSASAPLFVATADNVMQAQIGRLIPVTETIFSGWNIAIALATLAGVAITAALLHPKSSDEIEPYAFDDVAPKSESQERSLQSGFPAWLESSRLPSTVLGLLIFTYLFHWFYTRGLQLDLNVVNWTFFALGLLLAKSARDYARSLTAGSQTAAPILLQYPLYGGVMGVMLASGFVTQIAPTITKVATDVTLPLVAFLSAGLINFFIPSGGAQWTVQGPAFIAAATELGTDLPLIVMAIAYGDQWTNIIHPFTVIPVMILTGLRATQIIAYSAVMFLVAGLTLGGGLVLAAAF